MENIAKYLKLKEETEVEYKSAKGGFPGSFWETFSAFANTQGGVIVLGMKEKNGKFTPDGLTEEQLAAHKKAFWDNAHNKSCVSIPLLTERDVEEHVMEDGVRLLVFSIPKAPYYLCPVYLTLNPFGHTYKRYHEGDYVCSDDEVRQMFSDANNVQHSADSRILTGYSIDDIDITTLRNYRQAYKDRHENHPWNDFDDQRFLESVGAYRKDRATGQEGYTVAGMLMFGKYSSLTDPECCPNFFPDYREHLGDGKDVRWTNRVYPDGTWEANLYQFYSRVLPMLQHALPVPFKLDENQRRKDTTSAHTSLREAFGNCLIHCAYTMVGNIVIDRYDDRIVMSNPGTMLVSMENFWEGGHSVCRNPLLQKMFVFVGVGEKAGSGADIISTGWRDNGWQLPTLSEHQMPARVEAVLLIEDLVKQSEVETTQKSNQETTQKSGLENEIDAKSGLESGLETTEKTESDQKTTQKSGLENEIDVENGLKITQKTTEEAETTQKTTQKTTEETETTQKTTEETETTQKTTQKILSLIKQKSDITRQELAEACGISSDGIKWQLKKLQEKGVIRRVGPDKGGHWEIIGSF
jgi:predicted HTH transcriptional regulator